MKKAIGVGLVAGLLAFTLPALAIDSKKENTKTKIRLYPIPKSPMRYVIKVPEAPKLPPQTLPDLDNLKKPEKRRGMSKQA